MSSDIIREYRCEDCGHRFYVRNWALEGRIICDHCVSMREQR